MPNRAVHFSLAIAGLLILAACDAAAPVSPVEDKADAARSIAVSGASIRINPNSAAPSAAYFTLTGGGSDALLTGVRSPEIERAELHESTMEGGMMRMAALAEVPVPAGGTVEFRQGGKHVMLFGIGAAARAAGRLTLTLAFRDGQTVPVEVRFPARAASAQAVPPLPPVPPKLVQVPQVNPRSPTQAMPTPPAPAVSATPPATEIDEHAGH